MLAPMLQKMTPYTPPWTSMDCLWVQAESPTVDGVYSRLFSDFRKAATVIEFSLLILDVRLHKRES